MSKSDTIAEHQLALSTYLEDMLTEVDLVPEEQPGFTTNEGWKLSPFQALLIDVQGLQLAIPEHQLVNIQIANKVSATPEQNSDQHSVTINQKLTIIDTGKVVLPEAYRDEDNQSAFIIILSGEKWALACNKVNEVITLSPDSVSWRQQAGNRPWLAGTISEHKCGILNIDALIAQLEQA